MGTIQQICRKRGYTVKFITFDSGVDANKALLSNSVDLATMGDTNAVVALAAKIPAKLVWVNDVIGNNEALVIKHTAQNLHGKKIATPFASTSHYSLMMYLQQQGLTDKVELVDMQTPEIVAAWQRGDIDGAYTWQPSLDQLTAGQTVIDSQRMAQKGYLTANVTLATTRFIQRHSDLLQAIITDLGSTHNRYQKTPDKIIQLAAQQMNIAKVVAKKQIGTSTWLLSQQMGHFMVHRFSDQFYQTSQFMWRQQTLNSRPTRQQCAQFIDTRFSQGGTY